VEIDSADSLVVVPVLVEERGDDMMMIVVVVFLRGLESQSTIIELVLAK